MLANNCEYKVVNGTSDTNEADTSDDLTKSSRWNLMRQLLVSSTIWTLYFIYGIQLGAPTIIIAQLRNDANSSTIIDDELGSWLSSMFPIGAIPWSVILPFILHRIGRKRTYLFICLIGFIGTLIIYLSRSITHILIGEFIMGIILGGHNSISPVVFTEYSSPKHRGLLMTIKSASVSWGVWVANTIGTFSHWKNIYILAFLCNIYTMTVFAWPESPYWLAKEGRLTDCAKTYRKLNGTSDRAKKDLNLLIHSYEERCDDNHEPKSFTTFLKDYTSLLSCKSYYKPLLLSILLGVQFHLMGKLICSMYAIQILKKITQNEAMAYRGMLILDGVSVFSAYCGCVASRFLKRRVMLFTTSFISITFLYILSLYLYLIRQSIIIERDLISISLLALFSIAVCGGPLILLSTLYGELISQRHMRSSAMINGTIVGIVMATSLKTSLFLFNQLTLPGAFLFFAVVSTITTFLLYLYLPETKNKSCHEIENYFKGVPEQKS